MDTIAFRYAESLFSIASDENKVEAYQKDMEKVQEIFLDHSLVQFFSHVTLADDVKFDVIQKAFNGQVNQYVYNFLLLLIKKRRISYIQEICKAFESLCNDYLGIKVGKVYSAYELDNQELTKIEKAMSEKVNKSVKLKVVIDETLIGGIKVVIDNHVYDDTLAYKLESLKQELLRK